MNRLEAGRVDAGKSRRHILELHARPGRIGVRMNDPHEIGLIRVIRLTGNLDRDPLAGAGREAIDVTDQRNHGLPAFRIERPRWSSRCGKVTRTPEFRNASLSTPPRKKLNRGRSL